ncbi:MAG: glycoside hydrolase family 9 protein [Sphaerochaetaceae bacterium]|nr:glycoside hydrolase family 9 protein [Sphaerochaetaceae bacterium]
MKTFIKVLLFVLSSLLIISCSTTVKPKTVEITQEDIDLMSTSNTEQKPSYLQTNINLIDNGDFSDSSRHWGSYFEGGSANIKYLYKRAEININTVGNIEHGVQFYYDGFRLVHGGLYSLSFKASSDKKKDIEVRFQLNGGDYHSYAQKYFTIDEMQREYTFDFVMEDETDIAPRLAFNLGKVKENYLLPVTLKLTDVKLILKNDVVEKKMENPSININQLGFLPNQKKTVYFSNCLDKYFYVVNQVGKKVYEGKIERTIENLESKEYTSVGDFTSFDNEGLYHIETESSNNKSYTFEIKNNIYDKALISSVEMFYLQRCGMELDKDRAKDFYHPVCHNEKARVHGTYDYIDVSGGWHDAGDYGRYVVPGAKAVIDLLLSFERNPDVFKSNNIDLLTEVKYELDWMFKMQREDGGVYHKVTCKKFPDFIMPEDETEQLYVSPVSTCATGDFAATMAYASLFYKEKDPFYSDKCLTAAQKAWTFLKDSKKLSFRNPTNIETGEYPDTNDKDERYIASCALYLATHKKEYHDYIKNNYDKNFAQDLGWEDMGAYGNQFYIQTDKAFQDKEVYNEIKNDLISVADELVNLSINDGYQISLDKYHWGSNMSVCNNAMILLMANDIKAKKVYFQTAISHLDYLLGANSLGYCYLTGFGSNQVMNPHHRPSIAQGKPMEGMLIGGPDQYLEDNYAKIALVNTPPAKCYIDNAQSYSTNEVTIYWNSPFVYLLSSLM